MAEVDALCDRVATCRPLEIIAARAFLTIALCIATGAVCVAALGTKPANLGVLSLGFLPVRLMMRSGLTGESFPLVRNSLVMLAWITVVVVVCVRAMRRLTAPR